MAKKSQSVSRVFRRLFKPWSIPRPIIFLMPLLVALIVALISQYVIVLPVKGSSAVPYLILAGLIIAVPLVYKFRAKKFRGISLGAAIVIGFFLVPYFSFFLGQMHLFAVDQMPEGFTVIEMRVEMGKVAFVKTDDTEVTVWPGTTITLRPGVTRVYLGTWDIPAGTYIGRRIYINNVSIDVEADISKLKDPVTGESPPADRYQEAYDGLKADFESETGHFKQEFPNGSASNWSALDGSKFTFTMSTGAFPEPEFEPEQMDYPGVGGPDITLDFTLTEDGMVTVTPILDFPPGVGPTAGAPPS